MPSFQFPLTPAEKKKYVLPQDRDYLILGLCKKLEKIKLSKEDRAQVIFIKTQLENDWRKYLIQKLNRLIKKYNTK